MVTSFTFYNFFGHSYWI